MFEVNTHSKHFSILWICKTYWCKKYVAQAQVSPCQIWCQMGKKY